MNSISENPLPTLTPAALPVAQLESLKFKAGQIIESINHLAWTIKNNDMAAMPSWPDILSKYNILLSQTLNFSTALLQSQTIRANYIGGPTTQQNIYERIAIHPLTSMTEQELDTEAAPLLRNQQTLDVLKIETETVRRLAEHMSTRGSLGVLGAPPPAPTNGYGHFHQPKKPEYEDVLRECAEIREAHDQRVDRAVRAVTMLRDRFDWKQRVAVEVEEPEELDWDPRLGRADPTGAASHEGHDEVMMENGRDDDDDESSDDDQDQANIEGELVNAGQSPGLFSSSGTPAAGLDQSPQ
ncbi:hypothetical protein D9756_007214 [Leucocoprinus leucothites]|uniref:Mediator of RNA polymerase II transcription subunit 8 n=1 Tax=Leucocoprinus leucothites TaxID=201217 RepID=A0A8H5FYV3_9AGAR|nr:hypothetical protein D9756_007214 [Leucoagaricus leucothites]